MIVVIGRIRRFRPAAIKDILRTVLYEELSDKEYTAEDAKEWSQKAADLIRQRLKGNMNFFSSSRNKKICDLDQPVNYSLYASTSRKYVNCQLVVLNCIFSTKPIHLSTVTPHMNRKRHEVLVSGRSIHLSSYRCDEGSWGGGGGGATLYLLCAHQIWSIVVALGPFITLPCTKAMLAPIFLLSSLSSSSLSSSSLSLLLSLLSHCVLLTVLPLLLIILCPDLELDRYKYVVQVIVGEQRGQGIK